MRFRVVVQSRVLHRHRPWEEPRGSGARSARAVPPPCGARTARAEEVAARSAAGGGVLLRRLAREGRAQRDRGTLWQRCAQLLVPGPPRARHASRVAVIIAVFIAICGTSAGAAGDAAAGRRKALQCQTCHGLDGLSKLPEAPHLAGQPEPYLVKSLNDYRTGTRKHDMMSLVVQPLTDEDVADLAAYYAAIEITTTPPK